MIRTLMGLGLAVLTLFADSYVEISGAGVVEGLTVGVPR